jgi:hypothetical protein
MKPVGAISRAGFAWLTAIMTLVAGLPHFQCQCPNGAVKPFCFGIFCSSSGCCCRDACSSGSKECRPTQKAIPDKKGKAPCCCGRAGRQPTRAPAGAKPEVQTRGCAKSLAQQQNLAPAGAAKAVHDQGAAEPLFPAALTFAQVDSAPRGADCGRIHLTAPPPFNLVVVLQRFLI